MAEVPAVRSAREGAVLVLTLDRTDRLNAVNQEMYEQLLGELEGAELDSGVRAVVLTGAGRAFCAGADLKAHAESPPTGEDRSRYARIAQRANRVLQTTPLPVVAAVNGHAVGAGLELALSADLSIVANEAKLRLPEIALGTFVGGGVSYTLADRVGALKARELIYLGDFISGVEAAEMGLMNRAVPSTEVLPAAMEWAERLARQAPLSLAAAKRILGQARSASRRTVLQWEEDALAEIFQSADWREGLEAFREGRPPRYRGR